MKKEKHRIESFIDNCEFEGYHVTKNGRVFSRRSFSPQNGKFLNFWREKKIVLDKDGRCNVSMRDLNGKMHNRRVHRLVLEAYVGPCPEGMECCHNDGNAKNNNLDNLRWDTQESNHQDNINHKKIVFGEKCYNAKLTEAVVKEIRKLKDDGWSLNKIAKYFNLDFSYIGKICRRECWKRI